MHVVFEACHYEGPRSLRSIVSWAGQGSATRSGGSRGPSANDGPSKLVLFRSAGSGRVGAGHAGGHEEFIFSTLSSLLREFLVGMFRMPLLEEADYRSFFLTEMPML